eukprot:200355_1
MKVMLTLMSLSTVYQIIYDIYCVIAYHINNEHHSTWDKYSCYAYVVTNSANVKQAVSILLCFIVHQEQMYSKIDKLNWIRMLMIIIPFIQLIMVIPVMFTHAMGLAGLGSISWAAIIITFVVDLARSHCECQCESLLDKLGPLGTFVLYLVILLWYGVILFSVPASVASYNNDYRLLTQSVNFRTTNNYMQHIDGKLKSFGQMWLWLI